MPESVSVMRLSSSMVIYSPSFKGDNLEALKALPARGAGQVHLHRYNRAEFDTILLFP